MPAMPDVEMAAVCDVDAWRLEKARRQVEEHEARPDRGDRTLLPFLWALDEAGCRGPVWLHCYRFEDVEENRRLARANRLELLAALGRRRRRRAQR
jgi:hypothetical protein